MTNRGPNSAKAHVRAAHLKPHSGGRCQIGAGTSPIRSMRIGRELYSESM